MKLIQVESFCDGLPVFHVFSSLERAFDFIRKKLDGYEIYTVKAWGDFNIRIMHADLDSTEEE